MAHVYGIDLGSYLVKVAVLELGFRTTTLKSLVSAPVAEISEEPPPVAAQEDAPEEAKVADGADEEAPERDLAAERAEMRAAATVTALRSALQKAEGHPDAVVMSLPGHLTNLRTLEFPFADARKVISVLGYELEGQIPYELDEVVFDQLIVPTLAGGSRVMVAISEVARANGFLDLAHRGGVEPAMLGVAPLCYGYLGDPAAPLDSPPVGVLDIGHRLTNFAVIRGQQTLVARTISRGGWNITQGLARLYQVTTQRAAELKHTYASLPRPGGAVIAEDQRPVMEVVENELKPLVRSVRQTLLGLKPTPELMPQQLLLCGGSSVIPGLREHLEQQLELPVADRLPAAAPTGVGARGQVLAAGLAQMGADRRLPTVNLRQGPLAITEEKPLVVRKALFIAWVLVAVFGLLVLNGFASLWTLRKEERILRERLEQKTAEIFSKRMNDPELVDRRMRKALKGRKITTLPVPNSSAFAVLSEISRRVPQKKSVTLDVTRLFIREGKIDLEGTVKDPTQASEVVKSLKKITCFKDIKEGATRKVTVREMQDDQLKTEERSKFSLNIGHDCL